MPTDRVTRFFPGIVWEGKSREREREEKKCERPFGWTKRTCVCLYGLGVPILSRTNEHYHDVPLGFPIMQIPLMPRLFCRIAQIIRNPVTQELAKPLIRLMDVTQLNYLHPRGVYTWERGFSSADFTCLLSHRVETFVAVLQWTRTCTRTTSPAQVDWRRCYPAASRWYRAAAAPRPTYSWSRLIWFNSAGTAWQYCLPQVTQKVRLILIGMFGLPGGLAITYSTDKITHLDIERDFLAAGKRNFCVRLYHRWAIKYCTAAHLANVLPVVRVSVIWSDKIENTARRPIKD